VSRCCDSLVDRHAPEWTRIVSNRDGDGSHLGDRRDHWRRRRTVEYEAAATVSPRFVTLAISRSWFHSASGAPSSGQDHLKSRVVRAQGPPRRAPVGRRAFADARRSLP